MEKNFVWKIEICFCIHVFACQLSQKQRCKIMMCDRRFKKI